jgi:adenylylsulfate kinase-like enzyme
VKALLVTGSVGAGKTAVLIALGELLAERDEPYALVDLDWLCWASAPDATPQELLIENLGLVRDTFARAGVTRIALSRYVRTEAEVAAIRVAAGGELVVVALDAPSDVLEARLRNRDTGRELAEHLAELQRAPAQLDCPVVSTVEGSPADSARRVLAAAGW